MLFYIPFSSHRTRNVLTQAGIGTDGDCMYANVHRGRHTPTLPTNNKIQSMLNGKGF